MNIKKCTSNREMKCFYFTKENYKEYLEVLCPAITDPAFSYVVTDNGIEGIYTFDTKGVLPLRERKFTYPFGWYVEETIDYEYDTWIPCPEENFKKLYSLVDDSMEE